MSVEVTKNIINTLKIAIKKSPIVVKPNVVTPSKIATKPKIVVKPTIVDKPKIAIEKNNYEITIPAFKVFLSEMQSKTYQGKRISLKVRWYGIITGWNIIKKMVI